MKEFHKISIVAAVGILLAFCAACRPVGPDYTPVQVAVPSEWPSVETSADADKQTTDTEALVLSEPDRCIARRIRTTQSTSNVVRSEMIS